MNNKIYLSLAFINLAISKKRTKDILTSLLERTNKLNFINFSDFCQTNLYERGIKHVKSTTFLKYISKNQVFLKKFDI